jgi:glucose uptake protein
VADFLIALAPSLIFGVMSLLLVALGGNYRQQTMGEVTGALLVSLVLAPFLHVDWDLRAVVVSFLTGAVLGIGIQYQVQGLNHVGVSRTMPISTGGQLVGMALGGILLFGEWRGPGAMPIGILALVLLTAGVTCTTWTEGAPALAGVDWARGRVDLAVSTVCLVGYLLVQRAFGIGGEEAMLPQFAGCVVACLVLTSPRLTPDLGARDTRWSRMTARQLIPGALWGIGVLLMQTNAARVGVAMGFSLSQLGVIISTLGGIFLLGERRTPRELAATLTGVVLVVAGAGLIGWAKALDG